MKEAKVSVKETTSFADFIERMSITVPPNEILIIPDNYEELKSPNDAIFAGPSITVKKLLTSKGLKINLVDMKTETWTADKRGADWFGPTLFISSLLLSENKEAVSVALGVISNYISSAFGIGGFRAESIARFKILVKNETSGVTKEISYEGPSQGIKDLEKVIKSAAQIKK